MEAPPNLNATAQSIESNENKMSCQATMSPWQLIRLNVNTYSISGSSPRNTNARDPVAGVADPGGADGAPL